LFPFDAIFGASRRKSARAHDLQLRSGDDAAEWALGYTFDIVLRGSRATPMAPTMPERTPSQTVGPYLHIGLTQGAYGIREIFGATVADAGMPGTHLRIEGRVFDGEGNIMPMRLSRSGRPTTRAATRTPRTGGRSPPTPSAALAAARPQGRRFRLRDRQAWLHARSRRQLAGAAYQCRRLLAWAAEAASIAHYFAASQPTRDDPRSSRQPPREKTPTLICGACELPPGPGVSQA